MEYFENEDYRNKKSNDYGRADDFLVKGELMVTITLHEYRDLVYRVAAVEAASRNKEMRIAELKGDIIELEEKCGNLKRENEALVEAIKENEAHE